MTQQNQVPFDEKAALAELERLQAAIQSARRQRLQAHDQFDTFVRKMRETRVGDPPVLVRAGERPWGAAAHSTEAASPATPPLAPVLRGAEAAPAASNAERPAFEPLEPQKEAPTAIAFEPPADDARPAWWRPAAAGAGVLVLVLLGFLFLRGGDDPAVDQAATPAPAASATPAAAPAPSPGRAPAPAAPQPDAPVQIRLETIRPSWMRVIVDGEKVAEREFPAGQELRYSANREISVRAGDGGAVRVSVRGGQPAAFGRDGFPLTRRFTPGAR